MNIWQKIKGGIIVSCQAHGEDPFNSTQGIVLMAKAAAAGGACAIRTEGFEKTKAVLDSVDLPVIGLIKTEFDDGSVCITRRLFDVERLLKIGVDIVAVDGTPREYEGRNAAQFIEMIKKDFDCSLLADLSDVSEARNCIEAGADAVSTTLSGYTPQTANRGKLQPDLKLLELLVKSVNVPVIAEGRYNTPELAGKAIKIGAWAVVSGTAITRPAVVTSWFKNEIEKYA